MKVEFGINEMADLNTSIAHYSTNLLACVSQPNRENKRAVEWNEKIQKGIKNFWWERGYSEFKDFEVHMVKQDWGSTSAGWGGVGGAAMTTTYTVVIHSKWMKTIAVYYQGTCAYVMDVSDLHPEAVTKLLVSPPPFSSVKRKDNVIYTDYNHSKFD